MKYLINSILISFLLVIFSPVNAQYNDLLKDKNISWIAETTNNYSFEIVQNSRTEIINWVYPLKVLENKPTSFYNNLSIDTALFWRLLLDTTCSIKRKNTLQDSFIYCCKCFIRNSSIDTIQSFDFKEEKMHIKVVANYNRPHSYSHFKVRQILYFNAKKKRFFTRPIAIMPIFSYRFNGLDYKEYESCWIEIDNINPKNKLDISSNSINYAIKTVTRFENNISIDSLKIVKNTKNHPPLNKWILQLIEDKNQKIFSYTDEKKITNNELQSTLHQVDSTQVLDPISNQLKINVTQNNLKAEDIKLVKLYQIWALDKKQKQILCKLTGIAPVETVINNWDNKVMFEHAHFIISSE